MSTAAAEQPTPLKPLDTFSPRATLDSFLQQAEKIEDAYLAYRESQSQENYRRVSRILDRTRRLFDLGQIPPANRGEVGGASVALLHDILVRLPLPDLNDVPGGVDFDGHNARETWTFPETEIHITRIDDGVRKGEYLFAADTVERLPQFHKLVIGQAPLQSRDIFSWREEQIAGTGPLFPFAMVDRIPEFARTTCLETPAWKITLTILVVLTLIFVAFVWNRFASAQADQSGHVRKLLWRLTHPALLGGLVFITHNFLIVEQLNLSGGIAAAENVISAAVLFGATAWGIWLAVFLVVELIIASPSIPDESYDAHLLRLVARVVAFVSSASMIALGANEIGIPAAGLIAGIGVGGFAMALAAQSTVENLFGGVSLFADRSFRVGDFIHYGDCDGFVETIGPRSSRLRGLDGTLTTVPNADLAKMHVINYSMRDKCLFQHVLGLRYETSPGQFEWMLEELRRDVGEHPMVEQNSDMPRVRLVAFGSSSIDVEIRAHVMTCNYNEFLQVQENLMLRILKIVEAAGSGFAFPSMTAYFGRDTGLDAAKARQVEDLSNTRCRRRAEDTDRQQSADDAPRRHAA